jgi:hypothetical protein
MSCFFLGQDNFWSWKHLEKNVATGKKDKGAIDKFSFTNMMIMRVISLWFSHFGVIAVQMMKVIFTENSELSRFV